MKKKVFLVEDDKNFGSVLKSYLEINDFEVVWINDGQKAVRAFVNGEFDICIFDVMLPNIDGYTIAEEIKIRKPDVPFIFVTAKTMKEDIVKGFKTGADDYITKPFDSDVLIFKINAILKRNEYSNEEEEICEFKIGKYLFDYKMRILKIAEQEQRLSPKEAELLKMLFEHKNKILDRDITLKKIWLEDTFFTTRSMDVHITKLRKHLKGDSSLEIVNIHGSGFILKVGE